MTQLLAKFSSIVKENQPLAPFTWLQIGGPTRFLVEPNTFEEFGEVVGVCSKEGIPVRMLGSGSNLLVRESGFNGATVLLSSPAFSQIQHVGTKVTCGAGTKLSHLITYCVGKGLAGLEHLVAIPGTVGGAVRGNAGTDDGEIGQAIATAKVLGKDGAIREVSSEELALTHRASGLDGVAVLEVTFSLANGDPTLLTKREQTFWILKRRKQPSFPERAALAFVDPAGYQAAELIHQAGLQGATEGAVRLSSTYPNFLIASTGASSQHVKSLLERVKSVVKDRCGVELQQHLQIW